MSVKIHKLVKLARPVSGIEYRAACQRAFRFETGRQLRGVHDDALVTCEKCRKVLDTSRKP